MNRCGHMIDKRQHGFLQHKSCTTQLVDFCDSLALSLNTNIWSDVKYFDFAKAFDSEQWYTDLILIGGFTGGLGAQWQKSRNLVMALQAKMNQLTAQSVDFLKNSDFSLTFTPRWLAVGQLESSVLRASRTKRGQKFPRSSLSFLEIASVS